MTRPAPGTPGPRDESSRWSRASLHMSRIKMPAGGSLVELRLTLLLALTTTHAPATDLGTSSPRIRRGCTPSTSPSGTCTSFTGSGSGAVHGRVSRSNQRAVALARAGDPGARRLPSRSGVSNVLEGGLAGRRSPDRRRRLRHESRFPISSARGLRRHPRIRLRRCETGCRGGANRGQGHGLSHPAGKSGQCTYDQRRCRSGTGAPGTWRHAHAVRGLPRSGRGLRRIGRQLLRRQHVQCARVHRSGVHAERRGLQSGGAQLLCRYDLRLCRYDLRRRRILLPSTLAGL